MILNNYTLTKELNNINYRFDLKNLPDKYKTQIRYDVDYLINNVPEIRTVYLFGSCANKGPKLGSDIDILVITDKPLYDRYLRGKIRCHLDEQAIPADILFYTQENYELNDSAMKRELHRNYLLWTDGRYTYDFEQLL